MVNWRNNEAYSEASKLYRDLNYNSKNSSIGVGTATYGEVQNPWGVMLGQLIPNTIWTIMDNYTPSESTGSKPNRKEKSSTDQAVIDQINSDINEILHNEWHENANSIDDLYAEIEKNAEDISEANLCCEQKESEIKKLENSNIDIEVNISSLQNTINEIKNEIQISNNPDKIATLNNKMAECLSEIEKLEAQKEDNNEKIEKCREFITDSENLIQQREKRIQVLNTEIKSLETLMKQLKKAEGRDAIEHLTNDETAKINSLMKKYREADGRKKERLKEDLEEALRNYVNNPENQNITIIKFAEESFGIRAT